MEKCQARDLLRNINLYKSIGPTWGTSWEGWELADGIVILLSYHLWEVVEVSYSLVSLTPVPWKIMKQFLLKAISRHMKEKAIGNSWHDYSCELFTFGDEMTRSVDPKLWMSSTIALAGLLSLLQ